MTYPPHHMTWAALFFITHSISKTCLLIHLRSFPPGSEDTVTFFFQRQSIICASDRIPSQYANSRLSPLFLFWAYGLHWLHPLWPSTVVRDGCWGKGVCVTLNPNAAVSQLLWYPFLPRSVSVNLISMPSSLLRCTPIPFTLTLQGNSSCQCHYSSLCAKAKSLQVPGHLITFVHW